MALAGEVGELIAEFQWLTPEQSAAVMSDPDVGSRVRAEIGDVMIYLTRLADVLGIDLTAAALTKLENVPAATPPSRLAGRRRSGGGRQRQHGAQLISSLPSIT
ncbi:nucleotide pyrophosphohydrolase [Micromonospora sp. NPDC050784]|uniref:nucleotide pyrophosphohydrolase n=1 Tax=Micromonospora sp. NPDC050784 TaxID=3364281 RepID=UPI00378DF05A